MLRNNFVLPAVCILGQILLKPRPPRRQANTAVVTNAVFVISVQHVISINNAQRTRDVVRSNASGSSTRPLNVHGTEWARSADITLVRITNWFNESNVRLFSLDYARAFAHLCTTKTDTPQHNIHLLLRGCSSNGSIISTELCSCWACTVSVFVSCCTILLNIGISNNFAAGAHRQTYP